MRPKSDTLWGERENFHNLATQSSQKIKKIKLNRPQANSNVKVPEFKGIFIEIDALYDVYCKELSLPKWWLVCIILIQNMFEWN